MLQLCVTLLFCIGMIQGSTIGRSERRKRAYTDDGANARVVKETSTNYKTCSDWASIVAYDEANIKDTLVSKHEAVRSAYNSEVAAAGCPEKTISSVTLDWDNELARLAQLWANECSFGHGYTVTQCNGVTTNYQQNVVFDTSSWSNGANMLAYVTTDLIMQDEKPKTNLCTRTCTSPGCGHYIRLTNPNLTKMGCAYTDAANKCTTAYYQDTDSDVLLPGFMLPTPWAMYVCVYK